MFYSDSNKFFWQTGLLLGIVFLILCWAFPVAGTIDMYLIQPWMDATGHFPLQDDWFLTEINHKLFKNLIITFYVLVLILWITTFKFTKLKTYTWPLGYFFWISLLSIALIGLLKSHSAHACPWSMTIPTTFGYLWDFSATQGHCFPGGHASAGFSLVTGFFAFREKNHKIAYTFLLLGLSLGFITGWGQMIRGAHFLSHNLWTAWIILTFNFMMYRIFYYKFK